MASAYEPEQAAAAKDEAANESGPISIRRRYREELGQHHKHRSDRTVEHGKPTDRDREASERERRNARFFELLSARSKTKKNGEAIGDLIAHGGDSCDLLERCGARQREQEKNGIKSGHERDGKKRRRSANRNFGQLCAKRQRSIPRKSENDTTRRLFKERISALNARATDGPSQK